MTIIKIATVTRGYSHEVFMYKIVSRTSLAVIDVKTCALHVHTAITPNTYGQID